MSMLHDHMSWPRPHLSQFSDDADQLVFHIFANLTLLPSISMASCAFLHSPHHLSLCSPNTQESPTCSVYHELRYFTRFIKLRFYCIDQQIVLLCNPLHKTSLPVGGLLCQILSLLSTSWAYLYIYDIQEQTSLELFSVGGSARNVNQFLPSYTLSTLKISCVNLSTILSYFAYTYTHAHTERHEWVSCLLSQPAVLLR